MSTWSMHPNVSCRIVLCVHPANEMAGHMHMMDDPWLCVQLYDSPPIDCELTVYAYDKLMISYYFDVSVSILL